MEGGELPRGFQIGALIVSLLALAVTGACAVLDLPPFSWISDAQAAVLGGSYYPKLSFLCTLVPLLLGAVLVWRTLYLALTRRRAFEGPSGN